MNISERCVCESAQGEATAGTDALVSKALLREYQALAVAGDAVDPDPTEALVRAPHLVSPTRRTAHSRHPLATTTTFAGVVRVEPVARLLVGL